MITVETAEKIVLQNTLKLGKEPIPLGFAKNRVLAENIIADRDLPPFDRVTMDGIALNSKSFNNGNRIFPIEAICPAGSEQIALNDKNACIEVMTGAVLPENCDAIIRYEDLDIADGKANVNLDQLKDYQNIHTKGSDHKEGDQLLARFNFIRANEIGILATVGKSELMVSRQPRTTIISSGDELVDVTKKPKAHQIRKSNVLSLKAELEAFNIFADQKHLKDNLEKTENMLAELIEENDLLILSGGVSKGKYDYIPEAMENLGVTKLFHKVRQRPGKPLWYGRINKCIIFALPGNPVSSFIGYHRYIKPWLKKTYGLEPFSHCLKGILSQDVNFMPDLSLFQMVKKHFTDDGRLAFEPIKSNGSGDLTSLSRADGFVELERGKDLYEKGLLVKYFPF